MKSMFLFSLCFFSIHLQAQIGRVGDRLLKRTQDKVERKVEQKIDKKVDDKIDDALNGMSNSKTSKQEEEEKLVESPFIGSFFIEIEDDNNLKDNKSGKKMALTYHIKSYNMAVEVQNLDKSTKQRIIFLRQDKKVALIDDEKKTAVISKQTNLGFGKNKSYDPDKVTVTRSDETKTIEGVTCVKYTLDSPDETSIVWSDENDSPDAWAAAALVAMNQNPQDLKKWQHPALKGCPREIFSTPKKRSNQQIHLLVKKIEKGEPKAEKFSYTGYKVSDLTQ